MRMNTSIPMMGQQLNMLAVMNDSNAAAQARNDMDRVNALRDFYAAQGAQVAAGDQGALNTLAQFDPAASLGIQDARLGMDQTRLQMDATRLGMDETRMRMRILNDEQARQAAADAAQMSEAERAAAQEETQRAIYAMQQATPETWPAIAAQMGVDPNVYTYDALPSLMALSLDQDSILSAITQQGDPGFRIASPDEAAQYGAAGGQFGPDNRFYPINPPSGMSVEVNPDGTMRLIQGAGAGQERPGDPTNISAMIGTIDGILNDPALEQSTGLFSWLQAIPGTPQRRFGTRARQLEGQAFLRAYQSLRGSGQITEIEGQKATQAIGRLDTAQSAEDYRAALIELRSILEAAQSRPVGWAATQNAAPATQPTAPTAQGVTADQIRAMSASDLARFAAETPMDQLPDDVLDAIIERGGN